MNLNLNYLCEKIVKFTYKTKNGKLIDVHGEIYLITNDIDKFYCFNYLNERFKKFIVRQIVGEIVIVDAFEPMTYEPNKHISFESFIRFNKKIKKQENECWEWIGARNKFNEYGAIRINNENFSAHRMSYAIANGEIPDDLCVCHKCDNPPCVNPDHLFLGTQEQNIRDSCQKGRMSRVHQKYRIKGTKTKTILINHIKEDIAYMHKAQKILPRRLRISQKEIASMYEISKGTVERIIAGLR